METFAQRAISFFTHLEKPSGLPEGVDVLNPYKQEIVQSVVNQFYARFFSDHSPRVFLLGINPGRFGGGVTGISFTDPKALREHCGIAHSLPASAELSSRFVYEVIHAFGGAAAFYRHFYLGALYPLALVRNSKNYNYYDEPGLFASLKPAIVHSLQQQITFDADRRVVICLGRKNAEYLRKLNHEYHFFEKIVPLDHPRYIMQYKTRQIAQYVAEYQKVLSACLEK